MATLTVQPARRPLRRSRSGPGRRQPKGPRSSNTGSLTVPMGWTSSCLTSSLSPKPSSGAVRETKAARALAHPLAEENACRNQGNRRCQAGTYRTEYRNVHSRLGLSPER